MREIIWAKHGADAFDEIVDYITKHAGQINSTKVYENIIGELVNLVIEKKL
jgi:hypothetical protein